MRQANAMLDKQEQVAVLAHNHKMMSELGLHLEQRMCANAALEALVESDH